MTFRHPPAQRPCGIALLALSAVLLQPAMRQRLDAAEKPRLPNIIVILTDDQGYGDLGCYGSRTLKTPVLDQIARDGMRFTDFYVSQAVCSASRASLMTGCYANRIGLEGALNPTSKIGISDKEVLLPQLCKQKGYATALYGKWHLGHQAIFNPIRHGFDEFFGLPYPNDCSNKYHPVVRTFPPLPLLEGEKIVEEEPDQSQFTRRFTERSIQFIEKNKDRPFFLYLAHVMPHVPIFASQKFRGKSKGGPYGDVIEELDWSVGEVLAALKRQNLEQSTLVIFTSDNGPNLSYGDHAGSAGPLRGGKLTCFEGGVRMPCLMKWPGQIQPSSECHELCTTMDLVPTIARLIDVKLPKHAIDGKDIWPLLTAQQEAKSPHEAFYYYADSELHAVRSGDWKLHFPHPYLVVNGAPGKDGKPAGFDKIKPDSLDKHGLEGVASRHGYRIERCGLELYNLKDDIGETTNVATKHPDVVRRLQVLADRAREELGDSTMGIKGKGVRLPGRVQE
jgi:arylsulfatase